jgi:uncharacterized protein YjbI with pentapeptide repeats
LPNKNHVLLVKRGAEAIDSWKSKHPREKLDLQGAVLEKADLVKADLSGALLNGARLNRADIREADLNGADLSGALLTWADLYKADMRATTLTGADLTLSNMEDVDLDGADLSQAILDRTKLRNTDFSGAKGLDRIIHRGPCTLDADTLANSGKLPDKFLQGCGLYDAYMAQVIRVLIGSPVDLVKERKALREAIFAWNDFNSRRLRTVLLPIIWEVHALPLITGQEPQIIIDKQLVATSQILVCMFWSRLGTPTSQAESGTVHEINKFVAGDKPVLLYFCNRPIPEPFDQKELNRLNKFKSKIRKEGITKEFNTPKDLADNLKDHLTELVLGMQKPE